MSSPMNLLELDSIEILVIVDNELDPISPSPNAAVQQSGNLKDVVLRGPRLSPSERGGAVAELRMDHICCSAHGLSLLITGICGDERHTLLFDTGPEGSAWERNALRLKADIAKVELVHLSHWHIDHSGGMLKALDMIDAAKQQSGQPHDPVVVDLHPRRPAFRGMQPPGFPPVSMEADPSFSEIETAKGKVHTSDQSHLVLGGMFAISGEVPRITSYEKGLRFGIRCDSLEEGWKEDTLIADERFVVCKLKDKGLVVFTGCSHAGVVNVTRHAVELGGNAPLYAVMGGYHLADAEPAQIQATASDLHALDAKLLLAGHCTGWRAKFELQKVLGEGRLVPSFVGSRYVL